MICWRRGASRGEKRKLRGGWEGKRTSWKRGVWFCFCVAGGSKKGEEGGLSRGAEGAGNDAFVFVLAGYFLVHLFEHILAPHFHFGEETHVDEMGRRRARTVLFGLGIHTFFDGVAIAAGFLVSVWLGVILFVAVFLHKLPEGFTIASVVLASGQSRNKAILSARSE